MGRIFLDFDQTLCSTKNGGAPRIGKHTLDPDLQEVLTRFQHSTEIVTRNSCRADIEKFLQDCSVPVVPVRTVSKGTSKASIVLDGLRLQNEYHQDSKFWRPVIFVDDTLAEHFDSSP